MKFSDLRYLIKADQYRYTGTKTFMSFLKLLVVNPGFKYSALMRSANYLKIKGRLFFPFYIITRTLLEHYEYKFGISIPYNTSIGPGLYIGHFGGIVINYKATIGKNCNINHCVTIGATYGGKFPGLPKIGDDVYLGPGSKIIGGISLGNNVAVGANCVVTKSVHDNSVVVGIPGEVISSNGASQYIKNKVEEMN